MIADTCCRPGAILSIRAAAVLSSLCCIPSACPSVSCFNGLAFRVPSRSASPSKCSPPQSSSSSSNIIVLIEVPFGLPPVSFSSSFDPFSFVPTFRKYPLCSYSEFHPTSASEARSISASPPFLSLSIVYAVPYFAKRSGLSPSVCSGNPAFCLWFPASVPVHPPEISAFFPLISLSIRK